MFIGMHFNQLNEVLLFIVLFPYILLILLPCTCLFHKSLSFVHKKLIKHICFTQFPLHFLCIKNLLSKALLINYCLKVNEMSKKCISKYTRQPTDPKNSHKINLKILLNINSKEKKTKKTKTFFFLFYFITNEQKNT